MIRHPITRYHQLLLLLDVKEPRETLALIVPKGTGYRRVATIRSLLSKQRKQMRETGVPYEDFGIRSYIMPWTDTDGKQYDAALLRVHRSTRHAVATLFQKGT